LGSGLRQDGDNIAMTKVGRLQFKKPNKYWVEGSQKRYIPNTEDIVLGIVVDRRFEMFVVDIGGPTYASLPMLAFEGATRRNTPNLQVGAALYARVVKAHRDIDPELCCTDGVFPSLPEFVWTLKCCEGTDFLTNAQLC
jgi:exosome complex component RRP40